MHDQLKVRRIPGGPLLANSYLIYSEEEEGILIDAVGEEVFPFLKRVRVKEVLLTHGHFDHIMALRKLIKNFGLRYRIHRADLFLIERFKEEVKKVLGLVVEPLPPPYHYLEDKEVVTFHGEDVRVVHTPGHTPGGVCFKTNNWIFTGDILFKGSIGRTDFEGGDEEQMFNSLRKILEMKDEMIVFPGHGPRTTIGEERKTNPFLTRVFESRWKELE